MKPRIEGLDPKILLWHVHRVFTRRVAQDECDTLLFLDRLRDFEFYYKYDYIGNFGNGFHINLWEQIFDIMWTELVR
jgi:hypothetical protein